LEGGRWNQIANHELCISETTEESHMMRIWEVEGGIKARCGAAWWRLKNAVKKVGRDKTRVVEPEERESSVFFVLFLVNLIKSFFFKSGGPILKLS